MGVNCDLNKIKEDLQSKRKAGSKAAFCHGCFDGLHEGHLLLLRKAREVAEIVVVGIESDDYVRRMKGKNRPYFHLKERIQALIETGLIDYAFVIPNSEDIKIYGQLYLELKPDFLVTAQDEIFEKKGSDAKAAGIKLISVGKTHHSSRNFQKVVMTLCMIYRHPRLLLAMKKRDFGKGRWNGYGGKVLPEETIEQAARRETQEEGGITIEEIEKRGVITFVFQQKAQLKEGAVKEVEVHIFSIKKFSGEPVETDEMRPQWFHIDEIPYDTMWPDDRHWLPLFLAGKKFRGRFLFDEPGSATIIESKLEEARKV